MLNSTLRRYKQENVHTMPVTFADRVKLPDDVLISSLQEESVILNLDTERYFGLDDVGTRMLSVLTISTSIEAAYNLLRQEYEVDDDVLKQDLLALVDQLVDQGLIEISNQ
ncbi:MAG TPA: PqqD family protein [Pyrinomonadaceae bacterium]|nr:PqqD family protein [Pyrinomonadaceae bacterium]